MKKEYTATIGLEIHAELKTKSKMFCDCVNDPHHSEPNTNICPVCMAQPGTLPSVNAQAIEHVLMVGKALDAELADFTEFDRKNYFYPDIPKAYQISQYQFPLIKGGELAGVALTRIHLEEDTARNLHDRTVGSVVDFNRAGVPLMELVTEPVIHDAKTAGSFAKELQLLLRVLGVSDAHMEKGEMRVEANISVSADATLGTKVEVKNLNSFKAVEAAIDYEVRRHTELLEQGQTIDQETRGWDETKNKTFSQRAKETANDYRYFPDPDIPKFSLALTERFSNSRLSEKMPKLPHILRDEWRGFGVSDEISETILANADTRSFFVGVVKILLETSPRCIVLAANYISSDLQRLLFDGKKPHGEGKRNFVDLMLMLESNEINSRVAKDVLEQVVIDGEHPKSLIDRLGLKQESSAEALEIIVTEILNENESVASEYRNGKESALQFLVGQGMKKTGGKANPAVLKEILVSKINS